MNFYTTREKQKSRLALIEIFLIYFNNILFQLFVLKKRFDMKNTFLLLLFFITFTSLAQQKVILKNPKLMFYHEDTDNDGVLDNSDYTELLPETPMEIKLDKENIYLNSPIEKEVYKILEIDYSEKNKPIYKVKDIKGDTLLIVVEKKIRVTIWDENFSECLSYNAE